MAFGNEVSTIQLTQFKTVTSKNFPALLETISYNTNIKVESASYVKHFGILFDKKLSFKQHIDNVTLKKTKEYL